MSLLVQARTSNDDEEIAGCIDLVLRSSKLGLIHESVNVNILSSYTSKFPIYRFWLRLLTAILRELVRM